MRHLATILLTIAAAPAAADLPGPLPAEVVRVVDGDTFDARISIWLGQIVETRVRLRALDAPELHGRCPAESAAARKALERRHGVGPLPKIAVNRFLTALLLARREAVPAVIPFPAKKESAR